MKMVSHNKYKTMIDSARSIKKTCLLFSFNFEL